jgi:hypothetical protein
MATETLTGRLIFGDDEVSMDDGTVLAVQGSATPCATAVARYAKWGQTQPVTVAGDTGVVDNSPVLFVTSIQWAVQAAAADDFSVSGATSTVDALKPPQKAVPAKKAKRAAASKPARSRSPK